MCNILVETIMKNYMKVTSVMMKNVNNMKHNLQIIPNGIWIDHLNNINKSNAGIQLTMYKEDHNNTPTNAPRNSSSQTKEKVKVPETKMVPLWAVQCADL